MCLFRANGDDGDTAVAPGMVQQARTATAWRNGRRSVELFFVL
jgi:hypothetical protein